MTRVFRARNMVMIEMDGRFGRRKALSAVISGSRASVRRLQRVLRPSWQQSSSRQIQIGQREQRKDAYRVLDQTAVAHHGETPQPLHHAEGKLATGTVARAAAIDRFLVLGQRTVVIG